VGFFIFCRGGNMSAELDSLRNQIKEIDKELVRLLCQRMQVSLALGQVKKRRNIPIVDETRELEVISYVLSLSHTPIDSKILKDLFSHIIRVCREAQIKLFSQEKEDDRRHERQCYGKPN